MRRFLLTFLLSAFSASVFAGNFFDYRPPAGGGGGVSFPLLAPSGCVTPPYSFTDSTTSGLCADPFPFKLAGTLGGARIFDLDSGPGFNVYQSFTDSLNYERVRIDPTGGAASILSNKLVAGVGAAYDLWLGTTIAPSKVSFLVASAERFRIEGSGPRWQDWGIKPACSTSVNGTVWYEETGAGVFDTFEVCSKDDADVYAWRSLDQISFPILAPDGSLAAPSFSLSSCPRCGVWFDGNGMAITSSDPGGSDLTQSIILDTVTNELMTFRVDNSLGAGTDFTDMIWEPGNTYLESGNGTNDSKITVNGLTPPNVTITSNDATESTGVTVSASGMRIQTQGTKPTCDATTRRYQWFVDGSVGVADTAEICLKNAADVYAWVALATP